MMENRDVEELIKFKKLLDGGVITEEDFEKIKEKILSKTMPLQASQSNVEEVTSEEENQNDSPECKQDTSQTIDMEDSTSVDQLAESSLPLPIKEHIAVNKTATTKAFKEKVSTLWKSVKSSKYKMILFSAVAVIIVASILLCFVKPKVSVPGVWMSDTFYSESENCNAYCLVVISKSGVGLDVLMQSGSNEVLSAEVKEYKINGTKVSGESSEFYVGTKAYRYNPLTNRLQSGVRIYEKTDSFDYLLDYLESEIS